MSEKPTLQEQLKCVPGVTVVDKTNYSYGNLCTCCGVVGGPGLKGKYMTAHTRPQPDGERANFIEIPDETGSLFIEWDDV